MSTHDDDTLLDALAARVRAAPELPPARADELIIAAGAGSGAARDSLVEHSLGAVLDQAVAHRDHGVDVVDLFQEGSIAATVAVEEYVGRRGAGGEFAAYVRRLVGTHLDAVVEREEAALALAAAVVEDARLLELAELGLREKFDRLPTDLEVAAALEWPSERVEQVRQMLVTARQVHDAEIVEYLDDEAEG